LACPRVSARLMFGEEITSSSESPVSSARGVREPGVPETRLLRMPGLGAGLIPVGCSECCPPEEIRGSRAEVVLEGGVGSGSSIGQSTGNVGVAGCAWDLPLSRVASRSGVWCRIGVRALSGVRDWSEVLGAGDCPRPVLADPVLADPVLFRRVCMERVISGSFPELPGLEPPPCWLGSAAVGGFCTRATSPTSSKRVPVGDPGGPWYSTRRGVPPGGTTFWISANRLFIIREYFTRMGIVCQAETGSPDSTS
jgi:hypothetical protein